MKKTTSLLLMLLAACLASCSRGDVRTLNANSPTRDASSTSEDAGDHALADRLVGRWDGGTDTYFGERNQEGIGSYVILSHLGEPLYHTYEVIAQNLDENSVTALMHFFDGTTREYVFTFSADQTEISSTTLIWGFVQISTTLAYVDDKTQP